MPSTGVSLNLNNPVILRGTKYSRKTNHSPDKPGYCDYAQHDNG